MKFDQPYRPEKGLGRQSKKSCFDISDFTQASASRSRSVRDRVPVQPAKSMPTDPVPSPGTALRPEIHPNSRILPRESACSKRKSVGTSVRMVSVFVIGDLLYLVLSHFGFKKRKKNPKLFVFDLAHIFRSFWEKIETLKSGVFFANSVWKGVYLCTLPFKYRVQVSK